MTIADPALGIAPAEAERLAAVVARVLPPALVPLFDARFTRSHFLFDEYVYRLTLRVFVETRLDEAVAEWGGAADVVARAGLDPGASLVPVDWMLRHLAGRGVLAAETGAGGPRFRAPHVLPAPDAAPVLAEQRQHDPACLPSYVLAETAAQAYPAFLEGKSSGEALLLAPARLPLWVGYFSNDNALYAVNNAVGAAAVEAWLPVGAPTILELGGGLGSGAIAVIERLRAAGRLGALRGYRFTELVPAFLRRAERLRERVTDTPGLTFAVLDMNRPFDEQGVAPESVSVVYAVNTLHVAHDLAFTLGEVRRAIEPGGRLVMCECVRPTPGQTLYPEFVFNLLATFRAPRLHPEYRPNGGFLTPGQWTAALRAAGFDPHMLPDIARVRRVVPNFFVAAIAATRTR